MFRDRYIRLTGAALFALALTFVGCSRKADTVTSQDSGANPPGQQASSESGQKGSEKAKEGGGDQGKTTDAGPAHAADQFSKQPEAAKVRNYTLDAGSKIVVRTITALSTKTARAGDPFEASLELPMVAGDHTIAPRGTSVFGQVTVSDPSGKLKGSSYLGVQLTAIALSNGDRIAIQTATNERISKGTGKKTGVKVGIGAGLGALIGALAGGGRGAAIGAGAGGAAGAGVAYATGGNPAVIASESVLTFRLAAPVTVTSRN
jgi:hypothetical protein